jgi:competence protein ComEC
LGPRLASTVIKVPHHGSKGSIEAAFLSAVSPEIATISVGAQNSYGHPAPEMLAAYRALGSQLFRTDQHGAITIETEGNHMGLRQYSDLILEPVRWDSKMLAGELKNLKKLVSPPFTLILDKGEGVK